MAMNPRLLVPRASGFNPLSLTSLSLWLDASDATTLFQDSGGTTSAAADNDPVGRWSDKSGNSRHATMATDANRPVISSTRVNGRFAIGFSGSPQRLNLPTTGNSPNWDTTPTTLFVACRHDTGTTTSARSPISLIEGGSTLTWQIAQGGTVRYGVGYNAAQANYSTTSGDARGQSLVLSAQQSSGGGGLLGRVNGVGLSGTDGVGQPFGSASRIGCRNHPSADSADQFWIGQICEVIHCNAVLDANTVSRVEAYLARKWGVSLGAIP
jgi:hypothetical protein